jgi:predicted nucleotidyltransferase
MAPQPNIKEKAQEYLKEIKRNNFRISRAYLYGSQAKGNAREDSDIDIALVSPDFSGNRFVDSLKIIPFRRKIDSRIEPVPFKPEDFVDDDPLVAEILNTGIELK